ncbi:MAG: hypothetical protein LBG65_01410 [Puniceicoccales bacterium]|jgi:hypothetical protein|nr:hypothetical protein [Puniceicoccales bacterium]
MKRSHDFSRPRELPSRKHSPKDVHGTLRPIFRSRHLRSGCALRVLSGILTFSVAGNLSAGALAEPSGAAGAPSSALAAPSGTAAAGVSAWSPAQALTLARAGNSYLNLSLIGDVAAGTSSRGDIAETQTGGHAPSQRGFTIQGMEAVFEGAVDNYFRATMNLAYGLSADGESYFEMEEAFAETLSLPKGFQLRVGQYLTEFGRVNTQHAHAWDFVDAPVVTSRLLGPDGLRNPGARLAWLAPTPFYSEFFFGAQNSNGANAHSFRSTGVHEHGGDEHSEEEGHAHGWEPYEGTIAGRPASDLGVRGIGDLLYSARYAFSFEPSETQTILAGVSGAWGPNSTGDGARTQLYGVDLFWKWKPLNHNRGFPFVSLQSEVLLRGYKAAAAEVEGPQEDGAPTHASLPAETFWDWGIYAQVSHGFTPGWVASLRADYAAPAGEADYEKILGERDPARARRWRLSPALTWYPTEFSRIRLQYNYDRIDHSRDSHGVWLQIEFLLGAHAAHKF